MLKVRSGLCCLRNGLDLEVKRDEGEHEALQILYEIVEAPQTFRVFRVLDVVHGLNLGAGERNVLYYSTQNKQRKGKPRATPQRQPQLAKEYKMYGVQVK